MLPTRWLHLALGTSLLGTATAHADPCDDIADKTIGFVLGVQVSPNVRFVGGVEGRACLNDKTEALVRFELGGGSPRVIAGLRVRPLESPYRYDDWENIGVEAGGALDLHAKFGLHIAATYGTHSLYAAAQARFDLEGTQHYTLLAGLAPWTAFQRHEIVNGRPLASGGDFVRPRIVSQPSLASAEAAAVRDHYASTAQLELSSVWTFLRLAGELAAVGAPAPLVAAALDAADDEVRHALLCARAAGGLALAPLPPMAAQPRFTRRSPHALALLAAEAWCEGCLNETAAAEEARLAAESTTGGHREMLAAIARDETRHAELSWAVLAWLSSIAPELTRATIAAVPRGEPDVHAIDPALARFGVPTAAVVLAARAHAGETAAARLAML